MLEQSLPRRVVCTGKTEPPFWLRLCEWPTTVRVLRVLLLASLSGELPVNLALRLPAQPTAGGPPPGEQMLLVGLLFTTPMLEHAFQDVYSR